MGSTTASQQHIPYGVPQGSILGPILFNIHVNDVSNYINDCLLVQYADDNQFLHSGTIHEINTLISRTENTLKQIRLYFLENGLKLNTSKTQCVFIGTRQLLAHVPNNTIIRCADSDIQSSMNAKNLSVYQDTYMTFDKHISEIIKKAMGTLMFINKNKDYFDKATRVTILQTLVLSVLKHGITIWGTTNSTLRDKVQKVQNFAIKIADGKAKKFDHVTPLYDKWLRIKDCITLSFVTSVFKHRINTYPGHLSLPTVSTVTQSTTRQQNNLYVPRTNTDTGARAFSVLGPKLWNDLPSDIKNSSNLNTLKRKLKEKLLTSV